ncbi:MAG TPA: flagellar hook-associated protein FlgK [Polyangiales bacterium]|nr:flagellar hook-associated protein FlgK [Polyangiales bacterium]
MSINGILNTGVKGMVTTSLATNVTAGNISNAATVGYTRRSANFSPDNALTSNGVGGRVVEPFIQKRLLNAESSAGEAKAQNAAVSVLDEVFSEGNGSIGDAMDKFQASIQNLTTSPEDTATRQAVLANASNLSTAFQNANAQINQARQDSNLRIEQGVNAVNTRLDQIGKIGVQIQQAELSGVEAGDLRDQRDQLVKEVSSYVPVTVLDQGNGSISLMLGGSHQLVSPDGQVGKLSTKVGEDGTMRIQKQVAGALTDVTAQVNGGSIGGDMKARTGPLADAQKKLDQLAFDTAAAYNNVHRANVAMDGNDGRNLFEEQATVAGAATSFAVSADVLGHPENIAAATDNTSLPSDNRGAMALANVASAPLAFGGMTVSEALASLVGFAGTTVQAANQQETFTAGALEQVQALQDSASGVNTDEEMVNLMKYQRAYQASLKVISVADQMLSDLMNIR